MLPDGKIFLLGGEEPEYFSRREIHLFDPLLNDRKLLQKSIIYIHYINKKKVVCLTKNLILQFVTYQIAFM